MSRQSDHLVRLKTSVAEERRKMAMFTEERAKEIVKGLELLAEASEFLKSCPPCETSQQVDDLMRKNAGDLQKANEGGNQAGAKGNLWDRPMRRVRWWRCTDPQWTYSPFSGCYIVKGNWFKYFRGYQ